MIQLFLIAIIPLKMQSVDISTELNNLYWLDGDVSQTARLESGMLRLGRLSIPELRQAVHSYLRRLPELQNPNDIEATLETLRIRAEAYKRSINVAVLNRLVFREEMHLIASQWFGLDSIVSVNGRVWDWTNGVPHLQTCFNDLWIQNRFGYDSLREFDALLKARHAHKSMKPDSGKRVGFLLSGWSN